MFFYLAKLFFLVARPSNFLVLLALAGLCALLFARTRRLGRLAVGAAVLGLAVAGFSPLANIVLLPLEQRFSQPDPLPAHVDGIIVLGGAIDTVVSGVRPYPAITTAGERLTVVPDLARRYPAARIVHSGGQGVLFGNTSTEAEAAQRIFAGFGLDPARVLLEGKSRNTWENAMETRALLRPKDGETYLLVTSAMHMPRAMGVFRQAGWTGLVPYPVDWRTRGEEDRWLGFDAISEGLTRLDLAVREWIGLVAYWLSGRSSALFPAP
ncbi:YdcF family protein [Pannonibacter tanglangensis]|uniref:YdcF family protein n=1 Tax=Pannonibacter tanglangensis TaxID=2750084 RepID=A0ABW9ZL18_9HYPH|nr:YdcF family protein [Pannonibacter sp. XCT-34]NBN63734.1 YdcF family protein [Pannonibacter sp. XCT-34]